MQNIDSHCLRVASLKLEVGFILHFIPWGADWVFTKSGPFALFNTPPPVVNAQSILANRLYRTTGIPARYQQTMSEVLDRAWNESEMLATIDRMEQKLTPFLGPTQQETAQSMNESNTSGHHPV